jgi:hypothetical protein
MLPTTDDVTLLSDLLNDFRLSSLLVIRTGPRAGEGVCSARSRLAEGEEEQEAAGR